MSSMGSPSDTVIFKAQGLTKVYAMPGLRVGGRIFVESGDDEKRYTIPRITRD